MFLSVRLNLRRPIYPTSFSLAKIFLHVQVDSLFPPGEHHVVFGQILRDAEIAYVISPVVRRHRLTEEETTKFLFELHIPRAASVAGITDR